MSLIATLEERDACAQLCETLAERERNVFAANALRKAAQQIRARHKFPVHQTLALGIPWCQHCGYVYTIGTAHVCPSVSR